MKLITVYAAFETVDDCGRHGNLIGVFSDEGMAAGHAIGHGWYGGNGSVTPRKALVVNEEPLQVYLLDEECPKKYKVGTNLIEDTKDRKKKALAKLTKEDKELLGIED